MSTFTTINLKLTTYSYLQIGERTMRAIRQELGIKNTGRIAAADVIAVHAGLLGLDDAGGCYALSIDEYLAWQRDIDLIGMAGLSGTRYRRLVASFAN